MVKHATLSHIRSDEDLYQPAKGSSCIIPDERAMSRDFSSPRDQLVQIPHVQHQQPGNGNLDWINMNLDSPCT